MDTTQTSESEDVEWTAGVPKNILTLLLTISVFGFLLILTGILSEVTLLINIGTGFTILGIVAVQLISIIFK